MLSAIPLVFLSVQDTNLPFILVHMRISAIDLGSNAVRMMVAEWQGDRFEPLKKYRLPLRLGGDVFHTGVISPMTLEKTRSSFQEFAEINKRMKVVRCRAMATSAAREARNKNELVAEIKKGSGIELEIIDGQLEAKLIFEAVRHHIDLKKRQILLIDVGGGSVEITHSDQGRVKVSKSFPIGTVRLLEHMKNRKMSEAHIRIILGDQLKAVAEYFDQHLNGIAFDFAVGTGGNLECMAKLKTQLLMDSANEFVLTQELGQIFEQLLEIPHKSRIQHLGMRVDRADVIVPACAAVEAILRQAGIDKITIPGVGLRDGILYSMI